MYQSWIGLFFMYGKLDFHHISKLQCSRKIYHADKKLIFTTTIPFFYLGPEKYALTIFFKNKMLSHKKNHLTHKNIHFEIEVINFFSKIGGLFIK